MKIVSRTDAKPCPFCGRMPEVQSFINSDPDGYSMCGWCVKCNHCQIALKHYTDNNPDNMDKEEEAIAINTVMGKWNKRYAEAEVMDSDKMTLDPLFDNVVLYNDHMEVTLHNGKTISVTTEEMIRGNSYD